MRASVRTEAAAGLSTFLTAAYIIFVNPAILSTTGMDKGALVTVTCLATAVATLAMGLIGRVPLMMAPGMGLNSFFAYSVCQAAGVPWRTALGVVFLSSLCFFILALAGIRKRILDAIPRSLRLSTSVGIGFLISFIGLQQLGVIAKSDATMVRLGQFTLETWLGLAGLIAMVVSELRSIRGSILIGIFLASLLGIVFGRIHFTGEIVSLPASMSPLFLQLNIRSALTLALLPTIFAFMYVDLFDNLGTTIAVARRAGMVKPDGTIERIATLLRVDSLAAMFGALCGTSTVVSYVESAVGVAQGGRTGLTSVFTAILFFIAMFFAPLVLAVPAFATAPALIFVGLFMVRDVSEIHFSDWEEGVPAFLTMLLMPLTFSISEGIMFGFLAHTILKLLGGKVRELNPPILVITLLSAVNLWIAAR
ncbi:MAG TPA: NCS2 family permease [Bdellovibrionota bacterium]|nr:NCS2 family permease [Bdellovibrionota bacterium]